MSKKPTNLPEYWLRGPVAGIPALLQPVAHALLQSRDEAKRYTADLPRTLINIKPAGRASVAFHLKHLTGVLDRMLTYAKGDKLSTEQLNYLKNEETVTEDHSVDYFIENFEEKVRDALTFLERVDPSTLTNPRTVGRDKLPSTLIGLLFHAAEHAQRHIGQLLVTVSVVRQNNFNN